MGRRKRRRDSDVDGDLEESYAKRRADSLLVADEKRHVEGEPDISSGDAKDAEKQSLDTKPEKIEDLRRKKQERKQRSKEKKKEKAKQAEAVKHAQAELDRQNAKQEQNRIVGKKEEAKNDDFITLRKGVQYKDVVVGKGPMVQDRKKVRVAYTLRAKHRYGKILDTSNDFGFRLGRGEVVDGWDIGIQGMRQGGKRHLIVPPQAGYGNQNIGGGKGSTLFFEVTMLLC